MSVLAVQPKPSALICAVCEGAVPNSPSPALGGGLSASSTKRKIPSFSFESDFAITASLSDSSSNIASGGVVSLLYLTPSTSQLVMKSQISFSFFLSAWSLSS